MSLLETKIVPINNFDFTTRYKAILVYSNYYFWTSQETKEFNTLDEAKDWIITKITPGVYTKSISQDFILIERNPIKMEKSYKEALTTDKEALTTDKEALVTDKEITNDKEVLINDKEVLDNNNDNTNEITTDNKVTEKEKVSLDENSGFTLSDIEFSKESRKRTKKFTKKCNKSKRKIKTKKNKK